MNFLEKFQKRKDKIGSFLCIGLDPEIEKFPEPFEKNVQGLFPFCKKVIENTHSFALSYKLNIAFFEKYGSKGFEAFEKTISFLQENYPEILLIADVKRGDLANTSKHYAHYYFETLQVDSLTLQPYMGMDSIEPFLHHQDKFVFICCLTSNPSSRELQQQNLSSGQRFYEKVADLFINHASNIGLVVGATHLSELRQMRQKYPKTFLLIPGLGTQGGKIEEIKKICGERSFLNLSRSILYPQDIEEDYFLSVGESAEKFYSKIHN